MRTSEAMDGILPEGEGDVGQLADGEEHQRMGAGLVRAPDDQVDRCGAVEVALANGGRDLLEGAVGAAGDRVALVQPGERDDPFRFLRLLLDVAAVARAVDRDADEVEDVAAEEEVGERMLVVDLVVRIAVQEDADALLRVRGAGQRRRRRGKKERPCEARR